MFAIKNCFASMIYGPFDTREEAEKMAQYLSTQQRWVDAWSVVEMLCPESADDLSDEVDSESEFSAADLKTLNEKGTL